jgi:hypothetical protein
MIDKGEREGERMFTKELNLMFPMKMWKFLLTDFFSELNERYFAIQK